MSFHWNLSSEDELEGEDEEEKGMISSNPSLDLCIGQINSTSRPSGPLSYAQDKPPHIAVAIAAVVPSFDPVSDEDDIDWEDADEDESVEEDEEDSKPAAAPLRPITITIDQSKDRRANNSHKKKKRKRTRNVYRNASLSADLSQLLKDLHKAHILALMSRAVLLSKACSISDILHLAHSLVPLRFETETQLPTLEQVRSLCLWYFDFVNRVDQRRQARLRANVAAGAPSKGRQRRNSSDSKNTNQYYTPPLKTLAHGDVTPLTLMQLCSYLSTLNDENPQLHTTGTPRITNNDKVQLLIALVRSLGWRARYVVALNPVRQDLDVEHPIFVMGAVANVFEAVYKKSKRCKIADSKPEAKPKATVDEDSSHDGWVEILCQGAKKTKWIHIDIEQELIDEPRLVEARLYSKKRKVAVNPKRRLTIAYALGVEHLIKEEETLVFRVTDVTPRYSNSWSKSQRTRGEDCHAWFGETIHSLNSGAVSKQKQSGLASIGRYASEAIDVDDRSDDGKQTSRNVDDEIVEAEKADLSVSAAKETMPTNKVAFTNHAAYALASQLGTHEILAPDAKTRICGMFKGEVVYSRCDVSTARVSKKWLYQGRKVKDGEKPVKRVKARKKAAPTGFKQLSSYGIGTSNDGSEDFRKSQIVAGSVPESDGKEDIFAIWQTDPWSPDYVGPNDEIPVNEYKNIELALLNSGLVHLDRRRMAQVAKTLGM